MTNRQHPGPNGSGGWSVEPVHAAIVAARMRELRNEHDDAPRVPAGQPVAAPRRSSGRRGVVHGLRIRVGRALVSFGAFIEGPCDCPDTAAGVGAA